MPPVPATQLRIMRTTGAEGHPSCAITAVSDAPPSCPGPDLDARRRGEDGRPHPARGRRRHGIHTRPSRRLVGVAPVCGRFDVIDAHGTSRLHHLASADEVLRQGSPETGTRRATGWPRSVVSIDSPAATSSKYLLAFWRSPRAPMSRRQAIRKALRRTMAVAANPGGPLDTPVSWTSPSVARRS
jgi:hypothetical protein